MFFLILLATCGMVQAQTADLQISQTAYNHQNAGSVTTFTIYITNLGPNDATNVVVTNNLNASWDFDNPAASHSVSAGSLAWTGTENRNLTWSIPLIRNGETVVLVFNAVNNYANDPNPNSITASIASLDQSDPAITNNSSSISSIVNYGVHDVGLTMVMSNSTPIQGSLVQFTINGHILSGANGINFQVTDILPSGFTYVSHTTNRGNFNAGTGIWDFQRASSNPGQDTPTLSIVATADVPGDFTNTVFISHGGPDNNATNNIASVSGTIIPHNGNEADLAIAAIGSREDYQSGAGTFTVSLTNNGPDDATNVYISDYLDEGWEFLSPYTNCLVTDGAINYVVGDKKFEWTIDILPTGKTAYFTFTLNNIGGGSNPHWNNTAVVYSCLTGNIS